MNLRQYRIAILFPADSKQLAATRVEDSRLSGIAQALQSAGAEVIDEMGTKDVLVSTKHMCWGSDVRRYGSVDATGAELPASLKNGARVLKQMREETLRRCQAASV